MSFRIRTFEEYQKQYAESIGNSEKFWGEIASNFQWQKPWNQVLNWNFEQPMVQWFGGGQLNITENALDRHVENQPDAIALIWEPNDPAEAFRQFTYKEMLHCVMQFGNVLKNNGVKKGDRVCIYMPMVPELTFALLACARVGAIHNVVFGGFSAQSIADRINDSDCKFVLTADGAFRGQKTIQLKEVVDEALVQCPGVQRCIVLTRTKVPVSMLKGRDVWWEDEIEIIKKEGNPHLPATPMEAEDMLFILYTSGSTGKPKGVVHTCAGYMVWATYTFVNVFQYESGEVHFCTADIGWITGHSYIIYGPLCAGATSLMFEGIPNFPDAGRMWDICCKHKVNILYTAPTAIRSLMQCGNQWLEGKDLSSLKKLGSVGEPINEEAWNWYDTNIGKNNCPIVDTWWQTETGGIMISSLAGVTLSMPAWATLPMPGIQPILVDENGQEITGAAAGYLCIKFPWPGIIRTTYGDHSRCKDNYFATFPGLYFTGDGAMRDEKGNYRITGRVDDVLNISGHRIGTAEVENAINMHSGVIESAVVGFPHDIKGQGIYAFVITTDLHHSPELIKLDILQTVTKKIGAIAKPDKIQIVNGLPKTRSGKIMRRILRKIAEGEFENLGDTSSLLDPNVVSEIISGKI